MKVKFVNGVAGHRGALVIPFQGRMVCGYRASWFYVNEDKLVIVKQRSIWFTILILIHELAHWIVIKLCKDREDKQDWIDKYMKRGVDKYGSQKRV